MLYRSFVTSYVVSQANIYNITLMLLYVDSKKMYTIHTKKNRGYNQDNDGHFQIKTMIFDVHKWFPRSTQTEEVIKTTSIPQIKTPTSNIQKKYNSPIKRQP